MKIAEIKRLAIEASFEELEAADEALCNAHQPNIAIHGDDMGEKLTHVLAALWVKKQLKAGETLPEAIRQFSLRVRTSIS